MLNLAALAESSVTSEPFPHLTASGLVNPWALKQVSRDFPDITQPGVFPLSELRYGPAFERLVEDIQGAEVEAMLERKFGLTLSDKSLMVTVRGWCQARDGRIHTDSKDKVLTCLLYLNPGEWEPEGGRLRLLRGGRDLEDMIAEVPPAGGSLVAFVRTDKSWHGHAPFEGPRRYVMFNWMRSDAVRALNLGRHKLSAAVKAMGRFHG